MQSNMTKEEYIEALRTVEKEKENRLMELAKRNSIWVYMLILPAFACLLGAIFIPIFGIKAGSIVATERLYNLIFFVLGNSVFFLFFMKIRKSMSFGMKAMSFLYVVLGNLVVIPIATFLAMALH